MGHRPQPLSTGFGERAQRVQHFATRPRTSLAARFSRTTAARSGPRVPILVCSADDAPAMPRVSPGSVAIYVRSQCVDLGEQEDG